MAMTGCCRSPGDDGDSLPAASSLTTQRDVGCLTTRTLLYVALLQAGFIVSPEIRMHLTFNVSCHGVYSPVPSIHNVAFTGNVCPPLNLIRSRRWCSLRLCDSLQIRCIVSVSVWFIYKSRVCPYQHTSPPIWLPSAAAVASCLEGVQRECPQAVIRHCTHTVFTNDVGTCCA